MNIKLDSWDKISIKNYKRIKEICEDKGRDENSKNVAVLAVLCDCTEEDIWNLPISEAQELFSSMDWLGKFDFNQKWKSNNIIILGKSYSVCTDLSNFSLAQYIDFQQYWKNREGNEGRLLATFVLPKGKKYQEDYDIDVISNVLEENISITNYNALCFFFLRSLETSIKVLKIYLGWEMKKMKKKAPNKEIMERITEAEAKLKQLNGFIW